jgi:hypothetical protein
MVTAKSIVDQDITIARLNDEYNKIPNKTSVA